MNLASFSTKSGLARLGLAAVGSLALAPLGLFLAGFVTVAGTIAIGTGLIDPAFAPAALLTGLPLIGALFVVLFRALET